MTRRFSVPVRIGKAAPFHRLQTAFIAPAARNWLEAASSAKVLHVFPKAVNLVDGQARTLSVLHPSLPIGPFSVRTSAVGQGAISFQSWVRKGSPVWVQDSSLNVGNLRVETAGAAEWNPCPDWGRLRSLLRGQPDEILSPLSWLLRQANPEGLAGVALQLLRNREAPQGAFAGIFRARAQLLLRQLIQGLRSRELAEIEGAAAGLAGLGPGLTPAGDDFLVGVMLGLWAVQPPSQAQQAVRSILRSVNGRTTPLSLAWLRAAGRGEADETWHAFTASLVRGCDREIDAAGQRILARGHTSGWDALAGFAIALSASGSGSNP